MKTFLTTCLLFCLIHFVKSQEYIQAFKNSSRYSLGSEMNYCAGSYSKIFNEDKYQTLKVHFRALNESEDWIDDLTNLPNIKLLNINRRSFGRDTSFFNTLKLSELDHIRFLILTYLPNLDYQEFWKEMAQMKNLEFLSIGSHMRVKNERRHYEGIEKVLRKLKGLHIVFNSAWNIDSLSNLTSLKFTCELDHIDNGMKTLSTYKNLEALDISGSSLTPNTIPLLSHLQKLKRLEVSCSKEMEIDLLLKTLANLDSLKTLKIIGLHTALPKSINLLQQVDSLEISLSYTNKTLLPNEIYELNFFCYLS